MSETQTFNTPGRLHTFVGSYVSEWNILSYVDTLCITCSAVACFEIRRNEKRGSGLKI